jgi:hypothetical protein
VSWLSVQKLLHRRPPLQSHFASSTATGGCSGSLGTVGMYGGQRTWPAFKPRARPLFCLTSLGMFAVVLVDDVRYQEREGRDSEPQAACEFLRQNSACDFCVCAVRRRRQGFPRFFSWASVSDTSEHAVKTSAWPATLARSAVLFSCLFTHRCCCRSSCRPCCRRQRPCAFPAFESRLHNIHMPSNLLYVSTIYPKGNQSISVTSGSLVVPGPVSHNRLTFSLPTE